MALDHFNNENSLIDLANKLSLKKQLDGLKYICPISDDKDGAKRKLIDSRCFKPLDTRLGWCKVAFMRVLKYRRLKMCIWELLCQGVEKDGEAILKVLRGVELDCEVWSCVAVGRILAEMASA